jgi:hypothetical protein
MEESRVEALNVRLDGLSVFCDAPCAGSKPEIYSFNSTTLNASQRLPMPESMVR